VKCTECDKPAAYRVDLCHEHFQSLVGAELAACREALQSIALVSLLSPTHKLRSAVMTARDACQRLGIVTKETTAAVDRKRR
jgi:hypothetical protein